MYEKLSELNKSSLWSEARNLLRVIARGDFVRAHTTKSPGGDVSMRGPYYSVYSAWCAGGSLGYAMQFFGRPTTHRILAGACSGLAYLNNVLGYLHYDLKPDNIFVRIDHTGLVYFARTNGNQITRVPWEL